MRVVCAMCGHAADLLIVRDLVKEMGLHRCTLGIAVRTLTTLISNVCVIDADVYLPPTAPFEAAVLPRVPVAFTFDLNNGIFNRQVQRTLRAPIRSFYRKRPLSSADDAEAGPSPIESHQPQEVPCKSSRLVRCHFY